MRKNPVGLPAGYADWLLRLKLRIAGARQRAVLAANEEQLRLYHDIGRDILDRQNRQGWGARVIDRLSADLQTTFPDMKGLSASNLKYMRFFAQECPKTTIGQQPADRLPPRRAISQRPSPRSRPAPPLSQGPGTLVGEQPPVRIPRPGGLRAPIPWTCSWTAADSLPA